MNNDRLTAIVAPTQTVTPAPWIDNLATPMQWAAWQLYAMGLSIGPTKPASKMPYLWKRLTYSRIDPAYIPEMFSNGAGLIVIVGSISRNLTILDADTPQAAEHHTGEFERRGLPVWIVETARGRHFWWLSEGGEIANFKGDGYEIRGHRLYCLCPPSVHPSGVIYEWARRDGELPPTLSMAALDWLPLQLAIKARRKYKPREVTPLDCLSERNRDFIANGASEGTRNVRFFGAACDLNGNGFTYYQARDILSPVALRCGMTRREIDDSLKSAYKKSRTPAKQSRPTPPTPVWAIARAWAESHKWTKISAVAATHNPRAKTRTRVFSVSAQTARSVFIACCERARRDHPAKVFRASLREVAELAGTNLSTVYASFVCLRNAGYLKQGGYSEMRACLFSFGDSVLQHVISKNHWSLSTDYVLQQTHDAFSRGALNKSGERVWRLILAEPMQAVEIARRLQMNRATVGRALERLVRWGLASQIGKAWIGNGAGQENLTEIAVKCGTNGTAQRRKDRHAKDRARDVSEAISRRKRKWESGFIGKNSLAVN